MHTFVTLIIIGFVLTFIILKPKLLIFFILGMVASYIIGLLIDIFL